MKSVLLTLLLLSATLGSLTFIEESHASNPIIVNFDVYPNGTQVHSMQVITDQYANWSVVFTPFIVYNLTENEPAFAAGTSNYSEPNVGALTTSSSVAPYNFINFTAWFKDNSTGDTLFTDFVSVKVADSNIGSLGGNLTAYDNNGTQIGYDEYITSDWSFHTLTISRPTADIAYVTFWTDSDGACVDDFIFSAAVIPEFPTYALLPILFVATLSVALVLRRKRITQFHSNARWITSVTCIFLFTSNNSLNVNMLEMGVRKLSQLLD